MAAHSPGSRGGHVPPHSPPPPGVRADGDSDAVLVQVHAGTTWAARRGGGRQSPAVRVADVPKRLPSRRDRCRRGQPSHRRSRRSPSRSPSSSPFRRPGRPPLQPQSSALKKRRRLRKSACTDRKVVTHHRLRPPCVGDSTGPWGDWATHGSVFLRPDRSTQKHKPPAAARAASGPVSAPGRRLRSHPPRHPPPRADRRGHKAHSRSANATIISFLPGQAAAATPQRESPRCSRTPPLQAGRLRPPWCRRRRPGWQRAAPPRRNSRPD